MPDFLARDALEDGRLQVVLGESVRDWGQFTALWPSNRGLAPKVRVFLVSEMKQPHPKMGLFHFR
ncbi:hypothetical protein [Rhodospirillum sp. A1_3_36]|uniref:hypothetical protein n=1 Tax=Rhodospirillum sp. A1_3_36 TaxID=3391666 RepID=UPI0039A4A464